MAIDDVEWRSSAQSLSVCFFCFKSHHNTPTSPCPVPAPPMTKKNSPLRYIIWNNCVCHQKLPFFSPPSMISPYLLLLIISVTFPLTLQSRKQHFYTTVYQTAPHKTKEEEAQQEGGLSISAVSEVWLQRAARAVGGSCLRIWFHNWVNFSLSKTNRIKRTLYACDAQFCHSRFLKLRAKHQW